MLLSMLAGALALAAALIGMGNPTLAQRAAQALLNVEHAWSWTEAEWETASVPQRLAALKVLERKCPGWKTISWQAHDEEWIEEEEAGQDDQPPLHQLTASPTVTVQCAGSANCQCQRPCQQSSINGWIWLDLACSLSSGLITVMDQGMR
jgi:hypothetical protein